MEFGLLQRPHVVVLTLLDLSSAFDTVHHSHTAVDSAVQIFSDSSSVGVVPILSLRSQPGVRRTVASDAAGFTDVWRALSLQPWTRAVHLVHGMFCLHHLNARSTMPPVLQLILSPTTVAQSSSRALR